MPEQFGAYLRGQRELRGISLDEISSVTKISQRRLKALEEDDQDELPDEIFVKGYIRAYADSIGANIGEILIAYDEIVVAPRREDFERQRLIEETSARKKKYSIRVAIGIALVSGLISAVVWFGPEEKMDLPVKMTVSANDTVTGSVSDKLNSVVGAPIQDVDAHSEEEVLEQNEEAGTVSAEISPDGPDQADSESDNEAENSTRVPSTNEESRGRETVKSSEKNIDRAGLELASISSENKDKLFLSSIPENNVTIQAHNGGLGEEVKALRLVVRVKEKGWFKFIIDESGGEDFILPAGASKTFHAETSIRAWIGNKHGTELILNNQALILPEGSDNVIKNFIVTTKLLE